MKRKEYPRPQFVRQGPWLNLNGEWQFAFDDSNIGNEEKWFTKRLPASRTIQVPFVYQSKLSGIDDRGVHDNVWYQREATIVPQPNKRYLLHFGAVDYIAKVYVNGNYVGQHEGGDGSFSFDITERLLDEGKQTITVQVIDRSYDETIPRGKQSWTGKSEGIWYTNSTGIWQTVWLETVPQMRLLNVRITPDVDHMAVQFDASFTPNAMGKRFGYHITFGDNLVADDSIEISDTHVIRTIDLGQHHIFRTSFHDGGWTWSPEHPNLFSVEFTIGTSEATIVDKVESYFGLRKISTADGMIYLNNKPYYQRLVLDQGYWPEGLLTAPSDAALKKDIELAKTMGLNGARKHQKVEDPRYLYWADKLGFLVWEEVASFPVYSTQSVNRLIDVWQETITRDYNHPAIVMWVPLNESWGVEQIDHNRQQQHFSEALYHMVHALDNSRLVESNDGWDNTRTDVVGIHNYSHGRKEDSAQYARYKESMRTIESLINMAPGNWPIFAPGFRYSGQPIVLTEFGGIGYDSDRSDGWGYTTANSEDEYLSELDRLLQALAESRGLCGYCYTQLTDVEQEVNGLLTADRKPKAPLDKVKAIMDFPVTGRLSDIESQYRQYMTDHE
ncbi:glycoside hydrolase family 2 protein [Schleiferilactobacillus shenzhenensis]|uniref:Uncharacterized protein n=1 Tax=Schleiferilactobacillus shenzhenensis LY-73 TaxID=1231336 RepID=U4TPB0_9LACO|nr:glycoside hydrolase family 2 [Schleiferilactobacillus shenzhenensis]ERL63733.1 hypothetical protein L248_2230 [Schleiferilactobacillus shenzhenensis LY-73]